MSTTLVSPSQPAFDFQPALDFQPSVGEGPAPPSKAKAAAPTAVRKAGDERVWAPCGKCGGKGHIDCYRRTEGGMCFACVGSGGEWTTAKVVERRAKARDRYAAKTAREQEARRAARLAAVEAERAEAEKTFQAWADEHADLVDGVSKIKGQSTLVKELRDRLEAHLPLTENQAAATLRLIAEMATATPVPEGRVTVTGTVVGRKLIETFYTYTGEVHVKITVRDDRGFKVYGTASKDIRDVERGDRVTFTAALEPSRDDDTFGFFKRPTKASILERAPKGEEEDLDLEPDVGSQAVGEVEAAVRAAPPAPAGPKVEAMAPRPPRDASMAYAASHQHDTGPGAVGLGVDRW